MSSAYIRPGIDVPHLDIIVLQECGLPTIYDVQKHTADRHREHVNNRQLYMYYLIKLFGWKLGDAGSIVFKDHATALHSCKAIENLKSNKAFFLRMRKIEVKIDNKHKNAMNYKEYFVLQKQIETMGFQADRAELIETFTIGKKTSLKALTSREYIDFIQYLKDTFKLQAGGKWQNTAENKMRRKLWSLFVHKMNYDEGMLKAWVVSHGKFHKPLKNHSKAELVELVSQAELVYNSWLKEVRKGA